MRLKLFPVLPENLEEVSPDEHRETLESFKDIGAKLAAELKMPAEERELIPADATPAELTEALTAAAADKTRIEEHLAGLAEAEANFVSAVNDGLAALGVEDTVELEAETAPEATLAAEDEPEPAEPAPGDGDETVTPEAEVVTAEPEAAAEVVEELAPEPVRMAIPRGASRLAPRVPATTSTGGAQVVAQRGLKNIKVVEGTPFTAHEFAETVVSLAKRLGPVRKVRGGAADKHGVAMAHYSFPPEFTLGADKEENLEKIRQVAPHIFGMPEQPSEFTIELLQAAGGICAPPTPFYDVPGFASRERPVRGALPSYNAVRGGVSVPSVNLVDRTDSGVTIIEESDDAQGGTFATKACRSLECATWTDTFVGIISHCLEVGNLNARTWPEGVALEVDNLMAGWAAAADTRLLNRIKALSIKASAESPYNAVHGFIYAIARAKASIRNVMRAADGAGYTVLAPEWVRELLVADLAAQSGNDDRYVGIAAVEQYLTRLGVTVSWYKDGPTGTSALNDVAQDFSAEVDESTLDDFPDAVQMAMFLNGTFLHLDGGSLELGLVRDSDLNHLNNYELFGESFENVTRIGPEQATRWIELDICPTGTFPALATALTC
jgi:hypothetical protein